MRSDETRTKLALLLDAVSTLNSIFRLIPIEACHPDVQHQILCHTFNESVAVFQMLENSVSRNVGAKNLHTGSENMNSVKSGVSARSGGAYRLSQDCMEFAYGTQHSYILKYRNIWRRTGNYVRLPIHILRPRIRTIVSERVFCVRKDNISSKSRL